MCDAINAKWCESLADHHFSNDIYHLMRSNVLQCDVKTEQQLIEFFFEYTEVFYWSSSALSLDWLSWFLLAELACVEVVVLFLHVLVAIFELLHDGGNQWNEVLDLLMSLGLMAQLFESSTQQLEHVRVNTVDALYFEVRCKSLLVVELLVLFISVLSHVQDSLEEALNWLGEVGVLHVVD